MYAATTLSINQKPQRQLTKFQQLLLLCGTVVTCLAFIPNTHAAIADFETPFVSEGATGCSYSGVAPSLCNQNNDTDIYNNIGDPEAWAATSVDGERVCGKTDAPAYSGDCFMSLLRNPGEPHSLWDGNPGSSGYDRIGQIYDVAMTGTGPRTFTVQSRANAFPRYTDYVGANGFIEVYARNTNTGTSGWTQIATQLCSNTSSWQACTVSFVIPAGAVQIAIHLAPDLPGPASVDFDAADDGGLLPPVTPQTPAVPVPTSTAWLLGLLALLLTASALMKKRSVPR